MDQKEKVIPSTSMLSEASKYVQDTSTLRRLLFAASLLPVDTPKLWEIIADFAATSTTRLLPQQAKLIVDNIAFTDEHALTPDKSLFKELVFMPFEREHVGVVLISKKQTCVACGGKLLLRADRPSNITLYTDSYGTLPAVHYRKYCANSRRGCKVVQHYGYHTQGHSQHHVDEDWKENKYFISSQETAFDLQLLVKLDVQLLIGQISYKQTAEIYNMIHGYDDVKKSSGVHVDGSGSSSEDDK